MIATSMEQFWNHSFRILIQKSRLALALNANQTDHSLLTLSRQYTVITLHYKKALELYLPVGFQDTRK